MTVPELSLPNRALSLNGEVISTPKAYFFALPVILVITVFFLWWQLPALVRDIRINQNPLVLPDGDVRDGACKTRRGIFTDCEARLVYSYNGQNYETEVEMFFVDFHTGDYEAGIVISADQPQLATLTIGLDKLWNRIISLAVFALILGGMVIGMLFLSARIWRVRRQLLQPARLVPIPVEITAFDRKRKGLFISYLDNLSDSKTGRSAYTRMEPGQEPLVIGEANGKAVGLAVRHGETALPVLLEDKLERIDLTPQERAAALAPLVAQGALENPRLEVAPAAPKTARSVLRPFLAGLAVILIAIVGLFGYWLWYVTSAGSQFNSPGMDINNLMPAALNEWGCDQLQKRFGDDRAPYGCVAADFTSWK